MLKTQHISCPKILEIMSTLVYYVEGLSATVCLGEQRLNIICTFSAKSDPPHKQFRQPKSTISYTTHVKDR